MNISCVECHNMYLESNIKHVGDVIRNRPVVFSSYTGPNSFADGDSTYDGICEVCHTHTMHHRFDGSAPMQSHNDGTDCTICHSH
jgi:cytochrome c5